MKIGVLALQGDFALHRQALDRIGVTSEEVRTPGQLGMKGRHQYGALAGHHAFAAVHDERRDGGPQPPDAGSPDEDHLERGAPLPEIGRPDGLERFLLPAVGVSLRGDVDEP